MKLTPFSVARPVFTSMVVFIVLILGGVSLSRLPIDLMPDIEYPTLTVATSYENASPHEMEELVTRIVEEAVATVPGVEEITSASSEGNSTVRVNFGWGTDLDVAAADLRDRLDRAAARLPDDADTPRLRKFDPANIPIIIMGAASPMDPIDLREFIDETVSQRLERIPGVAAVDVWGGLSREIQVNLDPDRVIALGLDLDTVLDRIRQANLTVPAGVIERDHRDITLRTPGHLTDLDELSRIVVAERDGSPVFLHQVGTVDDTHERLSRIIRINGEPGVRLAVRKQSGTNTVEVARRVRAEIDRTNRDFSQVQLISSVDTATYIERSINNVSRSVLYGGGLAILVLLFFLRNVRSTLVVGTAIPISIVATFALIYFGGFTLNLMTLGGLALGVGMMVDNAIVVLENIARHREEGDDRTGAAVQGTQEVTPAVIAGTITTLAIFFPLLFLEGMAGIMFGQLGYVIGFSLICSLLVALTLIPMLAARLLKAPGQSGPLLVRHAFAFSKRAFSRLEDGYKNMLRHTLRFHGLPVLTVVLLLFAGALWTTGIIGTDFMPSTDDGEVRVNAEMEIGTRVDVLDRQVQRIENIVVEQIPEIESYVVSVGASGWRASTVNGSVRLTLVPVTQRNRSNEQIADHLREQLTHIPGTEVRVRARADIASRMMSRGTGDGESLQIEIRGHDLDTLDALAHAVEELVVDVPGVTDAQVSREPGAPEELINIDRVRAADLGLSVSRIARAIETAVAGSRAGEYREEGNEYMIRVRLADAQQLDLDQILNFTVSNNNGESIALRNVVEFQQAEGPILIDRKNQQRIAEVSANIAGRDLGSIVDDVRTRLADVPVPQNYEVIIGGDFEDQQEAFGELMLSLILAILLVYMVMACLYESLRDPLIVMFSVPLALIGVVLMLLLTETPFSVPVFIGGIMLGGIVVNNAILIVDQATRLRRDQGLLPRDAATEAGRRRLRPILMTSLTTILGLSPLALGIGEGAEAQAPMARAVIGGLVSATLITLLIIPAIYCLFHREPRSQPTIA